MLASCLKGKKKLEQKLFISKTFDLKIYAVESSISGFDLSKRIFFKIIDVIC